MCVPSANQYDQEKRYNSNRECKESEIRDAGGVAACDACQGQLPMMAGWLIDRAAETVNDKGKTNVHTTVQHTRYTNIALQGTSMFSRKHCTKRINLAR